MTIPTWCCLIQGLWPQHLATLLASQAAIGRRQRAVATVQHQLRLLPNSDNTVGLRARCGMEAITSNSDGSRTSCSSSGGPVLLADALCSLLLVLVLLSVFPNPLWIHCGMRTALRHCYGCCLAVFHVTSLAESLQTLLPVDISREPV